MLETASHTATAASRVSDRSVGLTFAALFALIAFWPALYGNPVRLWALAIAGIFAVLAFLRPQALSGLNRLWMALGSRLHRITSPLILGIIFFLVVMPIGLLMRLLGKNPMARARAGQPSYWVPRQPPGPSPFHQQF